MFSYSSFNVPGFRLRSLIHFKLSFVQSKRCGLIFFIILHVDIQVFYYHLLKALSSMCIFWNLSQLQEGSSYLYSNLGLLFCTVGLLVCLFMLVTCCFYHHESACVLKSGMVIPPWFFLLRIALTIWGLLWFHVNFRTFFYFCKDWVWAKTACSFPNCSDLNYHTETMLITKLFDILAQTSY